ncbi:MAG: methyltransferase domain-containing protein, partial [Pseudonocardia sp.]
AEAHGLGAAFVTKRAADGTALSSASAPGVVAMMLDQLDVRSGHRVLEIGAGTGYNAALLAHLAGPDGRVVTVDVDPECSARARAALDAQGLGRVMVLTGDGTDGAAGRGAFDRVVITAGAWDVPPAWTEQLAAGGRLVVPLRLRGQSRSVAFTHDPTGRFLRSDSIGLWVHPADRS